MSWDAARLGRLIREVADFPKPGIAFKDLSPIWADADAFRAAIDMLAAALRPLAPDLVVGPEARGFIVGAPLAMALGVGFAPLRKPGKLPWRTIEESYALEYGEDRLTAHADVFVDRRRVVVADDLLATGGTAAAALRLAARGGGHVVAAAFMVELGFLGGRQVLLRQQQDLQIESLIAYD